LARTENQSNYHKGTSLAEEFPVAFDTNPTNAVRVTWKAANVVAVLTENRRLHKSLQEM